MTNQLETAKEWLADLNKIIDKTDNEFTKEKRDVLEWLVESIREYKIQKHNTAKIVTAFESLWLEAVAKNQRYEKSINDALKELHLSNVCGNESVKAACNILKGESQ